MIPRKFVPPSFCITEVDGDLSLTLASLICLEADGQPKKLTIDRLAKLVRDGKIWIDRKRSCRIILTITWEDAEGKRKFPLPSLFDGLVQAFESLEVCSKCHGTQRLLLTGGTRRGRDWG
jgi:hypothetical protein